MPAKSPRAAIVPDRWMKSEKGRMTHQPSRDIERKKPGARIVRRAAAARPGRDDHSASRVDKFLRVSLDLFAESNFASVTIKDIAKALNVNTALIYYYFDSKTDLFRATIEYAVAGAFENVRALDDRSADPPAIIAAWLANHVNKYAEIHRFVKIALDFRGSHEGDPDIASTIESFYVEERKLLSRVIREGIRQGMFKPVDPNRMAQFISTYLDGCMVRSVILPEFDLKGAVRDLHQRVLEMLGYSGKVRGKLQRR
jgi:TetR/AcrR family transcriptional regulator, upper aerobic nicotinate degradation pathway regulator